MNEHEGRADVRPGGTASQTVSFHYIKSPTYRTIYVDGAWGGTTPGRAIHMALYSERAPIPKELVYEITEEGLGDEVRRETRSGIIREVETSLVFDLATAVAIRDWLNQKIDALASAQGTAREGEDAESYS